MDRPRCRLCGRRFSNGHALGGHMRSHRNSAARPAMAQQALPSPSASSSSFSVAAEGRPAIGWYGFRKNPKRSFRRGSSTVVHEGESDAESSFRRRLSRPRRQVDAVADAKPVGSVSDASTEEDVARCLMLLSRDAWSKSEAEGQRSNGLDEADEDEAEEIYCDRVEEKEPPLAARSRRKRTRYQCSTCGKFFRSYQALGGHRASHKRVEAERIPTAEANAPDREPKLFECPYCSRVFSSGQALGGHKRSHLSSAITAPVHRPLPPHSPFVLEGSFIDLNLPATPEEEAELSTLSVATEFASK
ncbi:zinc finger protein [Musa troglodytarum]|uniref:Zinc finger protein n=1 Tax=Musa troglodytarum TaxID=320322 RepID=A0A9E7GKC4_9LILI|nr:zinc finger protein [Musa troglodytarum]